MIEVSCALSELDHFGILSERQLAALGCDLHGRR
jgi:hypothetical protein